MRSIKPGRGPSMMSGVVGIFMIGFGILWTVMAAQSSGVVALFGVLWICIAIVITVFSFKNAAGKNRYSVYDIMDGNEEPDPLNERFGNPQSARDERTSYGKYCPYCGAAASNEFEYCASCGKKLP
ncbi:MAG: zinc ribbon domain-containing protein [Oscillospiraceae bacterium]|nr:zinc ribbon domain-containing protein [Oscillospiraceae bacterium]